MRRATALMMPLLLLLVPGCKRGGYEGPPIEQPPLTAAALQEKLAEWKGSVVVVDFWAFF